MNNNFDKDFFISNRDKLFSNILPESVIVLFSAEGFPKSGDQPYKYRQNSDMFYFTGLTQEKSHLILYKGADSTEFEEFAFIIEPNQKMITWTGHKYSKNEASDISGIENIEFNDKLDLVFSKLVEKSKNLYFSHKSNVRGIKYEHITFKNWLDSFSEKTKDINVQDLDPHSMSLRLQKQVKKLR